MNESPQQSSLPWRKIIPIALILLLVGYQYSQPTLERWFGISLPTVGRERSHYQQDGSAPDSTNDGRPAGKSADADRYRVTFPTDSDRSPTDKTPRSDSSFRLQEVGRDRFLSPAGLLYTMGPRGEHRIDHVMQHNRDDLNTRETHSVFFGCDGRDDVLMLIDEAYELVKSNSPRVEHEKSRGNDAYTVDMQRKIGYLGGKRGKKRGNPSRQKIRIILKDNRVITAYPST